MLKLTTLIGKGATRECYAHPHKKEKCVKIFPKSELARASFCKELEVYRTVRPFLGNYICTYDSELVNTDKGIGLVSELILDDDGKTSRPLISYLINNLINDEIIEQINNFTALLLKHNLFFYDFNLMNFVIQNKDGHHHLRYIDMKSFRRYKSWSFLGLERISPVVARRIMIRRLKQMYKKLKLPFPFK